MGIYNIMTFSLAICSYQKNGLITASESGDVTAVATLLNSGADPESVDMV